MKKHKIILTTGFNTPFSGAGLLIGFVFLVSLFVSCASAPRIPGPVIGDELPELSMLPAGGRLYLWADTVESRPLLEVLSSGFISGRDAQRMFDSTGTAAAVIFEQGHDRSFFLSATGNYPRRRGNFALTVSRGWEMHRGHERQIYWRADDSGIAIALGRDLALVSNRDPFEVIEREIPPLAFMDFRRGLPLAGWIVNPSEPLNGFLQGVGVPLQIPAEELFFGVNRSVANTLEENGNNEELWDLAMRVKTPSETAARMLLGPFMLARIFVMAMAPEGAGGDRLFSDAGSMSLQEAILLFFSNMPEQDGEFLTFRINAITANTMALLFNIFSVYSN